MSTTIDHQVVEMRFDNKHFEQNVSTTMSTLDKFKQKLNMTDAAKGLENVNVAAKKVDLSGIANSADTVGLRFNALYTIADQAFRNITNSAYNAGKNIVKSLTIDPVTTGFNEYELKMGSIQTIMAGTGESLDTVNRYLNELNEYSDKTIYSFKDMTSNIGKFTNAGVSLEDAVLAIKGISNEAALSGANTNEASRAMYNFSQALSAGFVKLIDWKSIELANMATKDFKQQLIDTAVEVGTLTKGADGMYDVANIVSKANASSLNATKNFNDSLGNQWMTTEVLIETLRRYADETSEIGQKATAAATEVKTFTMMMDTLKEAAQSGWAQTWELFVGDFEEAKAFFTELSDIFSGIIGASADKRNAFFGEALTSNWDKLVDKMDKAGITLEDFEKSVRKQSTDSYVDGLIKKYGSFGEAVRSGQLSVRVLNNALDDIADTKAGKTVAAFVDGLKEIKRILKYDSVGEDVKKLQTALDSLGYDLGAPGIDGIIGPITEAAIKAFQKDHNLEIDGIVGPETLAALEAAGIKVNELEGDVDDLKSSCKDLIKVITQKSGRELLLNSLLNIITAIRKPLGAVSKAFGKVFDFKPTQLYNLIENFNKLTKALIINDETAEKLVKTFEGIFSVFKIVTTFAGGAFSMAFKALMLVLEKFDIGFLDLTANIGEGLTKLSDFINSLIKEGLGAAIDWALPKMVAFIEVVKKWVAALKESKVGKEVADIFKNWPQTLEKISGAFDSCVKAIQGWIEELRNTQLYKDVSGWFSGIGDSISNAVTNIKNSIANFNISGFSDRFVAVQEFFSGLYETLKTNRFVVAAVDGIKNAFGKVKDFFGKFKLPEFNLDNMKAWFDKLAWFEVSEDAAGGGVKGFFQAIGDYFNGNVIKLNIRNFKETALQKFAEFYLKMGDKIKAAFEKCKEIMAAVAEFIFGSKDVKLPDIIDLGKTILEILVLIEALKALQKIVSPLDNITSALDNVATSLKWSAMTGMFKAMALALGVFTICLIVISQIPAEDAIRSSILLGSLIVVLAGVVALMGFFAGKIDGGVDMAGAIAAMLMLVGSVVVLVYALKEIDKLDLKHPFETFLKLFGIILAMTAGVKMIGKAGSTSFRSVAAILTLMAALKMMLDVVEAYDKFHWSGKGDAVFRVIGMIVALSVAINLASRGIKQGASASGLALSIIAMVVALKLIIGTIDDIAAIPEENIKKAAPIIAGILGFMALIMAVANLTNKGIKLDKGQKAVNNFAGFAVALLAVVAVIWILGKMALNHEAELIKGGNAVGAIMLAFTAMFTAIGLACSGLKMGSIWSMIAGIVIVMAALGTAIYLLRDVPWQTSLGVAGAMALVILAMGHALKTLVKYDVYSGNIWHWVGAMAVLAVIAAGLGLVIKSCKDVSFGTAIGVAGGIAILLVAMTGVLKILATTWVPAKTIWQWIPALAALTVLVVGLSHLIKNMDGIDADGAVKNAAALSLLLVALTGAMTVLTAMSKFAKPTGMLAGVLGIGILGTVVWELGYILNAMKTYDLGGMMEDVKVLSVLIVVLTAVMAAVSGLGLILAGGGTFIPALGAAAAILGISLLGAVVLELGYVLSLMREWNIGSMMEDVKVLSTLLVVLTGVMIALSLFGALAPAGIVGVVGIALLGAVVLELGYFLSLMTTWRIAERADDVAVLSGLLITLTKILAVLAVVGVLGVSAIAGVAGIALLGAVVLELGYFLSLMRDYGISGMQGDVDVLSALLSNLTGVLADLAVVGVFTVPAIAGVGALVTLITALAGLFAAIGLLEEWFGIGDTIDKAIEIINKIANGLGSAVGNLVSGFVDGLGDSLDSLGNQLSSFADNAGRFFEVVEGLGQDTVAGAKAMVDVVKALLDAEFASRFKGKGEGLSDIGIELSIFADNLNGFITAMSSIKPETATTIKTVCESLETLIAIDTNYTGGRNLGAFGENIAAFANCIKDASATLKAITDTDVENIERAVKAGRALADLNGAIPVQGGWAAAIMGKQDLAEFGLSIVAFGKALVEYSNAVKGDGMDTDAIIRSAEAGSSLAELNGAIPEQGGWAEMIMGEQDLAEFGLSIVAFGKALVAYSNSITGSSFDAEKVKASAAAGKALAELNGAIPEQGGWAAAILGEQDMAAFGASIIAFGKGLGNYYSTVSSIDFESFIPAIRSSGTALDEIKNVMNKVPEKANWWDKLWGNDKDGGSFGDAITSVANGVKRFCTVAVSIADQTGSISNVGTAVGNIKEVLGKIPDDETIAKADKFSNAVNSLEQAASTLSSFTTAGYDYSGLSPFKTAVAIIKNVFLGTDIESLSEKYSKGYAISTHASKIAKELSKINDYTYDGVASFKKAITDLGKADVDSMINAFRGKTGDVKTVVGGFISAMGSAIDQKASSLSTKMENLVDRAINTAEHMTGDFRPIGNKMGDKLASGIGDKKSSVKTAGQTLGSEAAWGAKQGYTGMYNAGKYLVDGFVKGIDDNDYRAAAKAAAMAEVAVAAAKAALAINSPSKVFRAIGYSVPEGFAMGIDRMGWMVKDSTVAMGNLASTSLSSTISRISDAINTDIDAQPTIRPVLDLSDVRAGAGTIGNMLGGDASIGVLSNVGTISTMMNRRSQNGSNAEVVSAIKDLRRDLANVGNTSYHIDGVTYDDGSNISDAVKTIVRAAKMGRRI